MAIAAHPSPQRRTSDKLCVFYVSSEAAVGLSCSQCQSPSTPNAHDPLGQRPCMVRHLRLQRYSNSSRDLGRVTQHLQALCWNPSSSLLGFLPCLFGTAKHSNAHLAKRACAASALVDLRESRQSRIQTNDERMKEISNQARLVIALLAKPHARHIQATRLTK